MNQNNPKPKAGRNQPDAHTQSKDSQFTVVQPTTVWERQPNESAPAFEAFQMYLTVKDEGGGSYLTVAKRLGKSGQLMQRWSARHNWVERHRAYENHKILLMEREKSIAIKKEAEKWAKRRVDIREVGYEIGQLMIERARNLMKLPVFETVQEGFVTDSEGKRVATKTVFNFQQHPRDARLIAQTALQLMRLSADMSTENVNLLPVDMNFEGKSDEELEMIAEQLLEMRKKDLESGNV